MPNADQDELDNPLRVVIADDLELLRIGLWTVLEAEPGLTVVGIAANGREAVELCQRLRPDLALLDERMPVLDGIEAARLIKQQNRAIRVLTLASPSEVGERARVMKAGVDAWLPKHVTRGELIATLWGLVGRGEAPQPYGGTRAPDGERYEQLTPRELDVLRLLARGKTNSEIAQVLSLSRGTIKAYVEQIIAKLRVSGRTHAAVRAVELGLLIAEYE